MRKARQLPAEAKVDATLRPLQNAHILGGDDPIGRYGAENRRSCSPGRLQSIGGSQSDHWNNTLANQTLQALWVKNSSPEDHNKQLSATVAALMGIAPKDELEVMMAAQLVAERATLIRPSAGPPLAPACPGLACGPPAYLRKLIFRPRLLRNRSALSGRKELMLVPRPRPSARDHFH
jgi:hypothetical protein